MGAGGEGNRRVPTPVAGNSSQTRPPIMPHMQTTGLPSDPSSTLGQVAQRDVAGGIAPPPSSTLSTVSGTDLTPLGTAAAIVSIAAMGRARVPTAEEGPYGFHEIEMAANARSHGGTDYFHAQGVSHEEYIAPTLRGPQSGATARGRPMSMYAFTDVGVHAAHLRDRSPSVESSVCQKSLGRGEGSIWADRFSFGGIFDLHFY